LPGLIRTRDRETRQLRRDSPEISIACRSTGRTFFDPPLADILDGIELHTVADLDCGGADPDRRPGPSARRLAWHRH
jgi:phenylpyruvate C(3)-methyltransferase